MKARPAADATLDDLRARITELDERTVGLLAERIALARALCPAKRRLGCDTYDPAREAAVVRHAADRAEAMGLDAEEVRELFWRIIRMSRDAQLEGAPDGGRGCQAGSAS